MSFGEIGAGVLTLLVAIIPFLIKLYWERNNKRAQEAERQAKSDLTEALKRTEQATEIRRKNDELEAKQRAIEQWEAEHATNQNKRGT